MSRIIKAGDRIRGANDQVAVENRQAFAAAGIMSVNIMSSPGAGKTTLIEETIRGLQGKLRIGVIEGDIATDRDAERVQAAGAAAVVQITTEGACHLDAQMVKMALKDFPLMELDLVIIENVGNLVCPTNFDLGENYRALVSAVTEGEDKPKKYPGMFLSAEVLALNKMDLLPYVNVDAERFIAEALDVNPKLRVFKTSATRGDGMDAWRDWLMGIAGGEARR
jgi:hydrogenase nickel incorporation protein HypB